MTRMPDFEAGLGAVEGFVERVLHHDAQPAPGQNPYPDTAQTRADIPAITSQEAPVSLLTDAKTAIEDLAAHVAELAANPLIDALAEAGLGLVLSPAEVQAAVALIGTFEASRKQPDANTTPPA